MSICKHFTKDWQLSHNISNVAKAEWGEHHVMDALEVMKEERELVKQPLLIGRAVGLGITGHYPDIYVQGVNHDYLIEVRNVWYYWMPDWKGRAGFYQQNYKWVEQITRGKVWGAESYPVRAKSGVHSHDSVLINKQNGNAIPIFCSTIPSFSPNALTEMHRFFGTRMIFSDHPFIPEGLDSDEDCVIKENMRFYDKLLRTIEECEKS